MAFNILCLSGGGFLGLYTASVLAKIEEECGQPLHRKFDLIAGTSIGGILALAIASGKHSMADVVKLMVESGPKIFGAKPPSPKLDLIRYWKRPKHDPSVLKSMIEIFVGADTFLADLKQNVIVPAVNVTKGGTQVFKTPHHPSFTRDWKLKVSDVALATSAAPTFFPLHEIGHERFADGGLYANSPDELALHEAQHFLGQNIDEISILSIGTTTSKFSFGSDIRSDIGWLGWMSDQRLISAMIGSQQMNADFIMSHRLNTRYLRIDAEPSPGQLKNMALDSANPAVIKDLQGLAEASFRNQLRNIKKIGFLGHGAPERDYLARSEIAQYFQARRG